MWPFSEMSLATASLVGTTANWVLLASLVGGVLSTFVIVKTSDVKEEHWAEDRRHSNEKMAELGTQAEQLRKSTAEANARAAEAQLALEKFKAPRTISPEGQRRISAKIGAFPGQEYQGAVASALNDGLLFWEAIHKTLAGAKWTFVAPSGLAHGDPPAVIPISAAPGLLVAFAPEAKPNVSAAAKVLADALAEEGFDARAASAMFGEMAQRPTMIMVVIGAKIK
jgi:hypothetical protein